MADVYSDRLRQLLMAQGDYPDTWWDKMITNLLLVEQGIDGYVVVNLPPSGSYALVTADGSADEARRASLWLAGDITGNVTVIPPSQHKIYFLQNRTTGSSAVTMQIGGGESALLERDGFSIVLCDGTDCHLLKMSYEQDVINNESAISMMEQQLSILETDFGNVEIAPPAYPVGSIYFSVDSTDPNTILGYGSWIKTSRGRAIFGENAADPDFDRITTINGGENSITLQEANLPPHTHAGTLSQEASHDHLFNNVGNVGSVSIPGSNTIAKIPPTQTGQTNSVPHHTHGGLTTNAGGSAAITKIPPHLVVYIWVRTA